MVHYNVKRPPLVPILSQINSVHITRSYLSTIHSVISHLHLHLPTGLFPSGFPTKNLFVSIHASRPNRLILLVLIILIILGEEYKL
jgi:hypothetical protein